jgi:hypothetical protein
VSQTSLIAFYLIAGFLIYITVRNEWGVYYGFLAGTPTKTGGISLPGLGPGITFAPTAPGNTTIPGTGGAPDVTFPEPGSLMPGP